MTLAWIATICHESIDFFHLKLKNQLKKDQIVFENVVCTISNEISSCSLQYSWHDFISNVVLDPIFLVKNLL